MLVFLYNIKFKSIQFMSNLGAKNMKKIMCYTFSEYFFKFTVALAKCLNFALCNISCIVLVSKLKSLLFWFPLYGFY